MMTRDSQASGGSKYGSAKYFNNSLVDPAGTKSPSLKWRRSRSGIGVLLTDTESQTKQLVIEYWLH